MSLLFKRYALAVLACIGLIIVNLQLEIISKSDLSRNVDISEDNDSNGMKYKYKFRIVWGIVNETLKFIRLEEINLIQSYGFPYKGMNEALNKVEKIIHEEKTPVKHKNAMSEIVNIQLSTNKNTTIFKKWLKTYKFDVPPVIKHIIDICTEIVGNVTNRMCYNLVSENVEEIKFKIECNTYMSLYRKWSYSIYIYIGQNVVFGQNVDIIRTFKSTIDIDSDSCGNNFNLNDTILLRKCDFFKDIIQEVSSRINEVPKTIYDIIINQLLKLETDINQTLIDNTNTIVAASKDTIEETKKYLQYTMFEYLGQAIITSFSESQIQIFISTNSLEQRYINLMNVKFEFRTNAFDYGFIIAQIPGGSLAYVYTAHNVFGITILLATIFYILTLIIASDLRMGFDSILILIRFCHGLFMGMANPACNGIWRLWAPPNERPILSTIALLSTFTKLFHSDLDIILEDMKIQTFLYYLFGILGLIWYIVWLYLIYGRSLSYIQRNTLVERSINNMEFSLNTTHLSIKQKFCNVPWKKMFTSIPVYAIIVASICDGSNNPVIEILMYTYILGNVNFKIVVISFSIFTKMFVILSFCGVILTNLCRKMSSISTTIIRKLVTCFSFMIQIIMFLVVFYDLRILTNISSIYWLFAFNLFKEISYLGYGVNQIDIAPQYASILMGIINTIGQISQYYFYYMFGIMYQYKIINDHQLSILAAILLFIGTIFYSQFASGVQQPWAELQIEK